VTLLLARITENKKTREAIADSIAMFIEAIDVTECTDFCRYYKPGRRCFALKIGGVTEYYKEAIMTDGGIYVIADVSMKYDSVPDFVLAEMRAKEQPSDPITRDWNTPQEDAAWEHLKK
jgi:hypothetical protein